jgi:hypothetical protein
MMMPTLGDGFGWKERCCATFFLYSMVHRGIVHSVEVLRSRYGMFHDLHSLDFRSFQKYVTIQRLEHPTASKLTN